MTDLKARMAASGISQSELAQVSGCATGTISQWLRGHLTISQVLEGRIIAAVDRLEKANAAAAAVRSQVLQETEPYRKE